MITDDDIRNAWAAIARTDAGQVAYLHLRSIRMEVTTATKGSALKADQGRRMVAAELMGLMASESAESQRAGSAADPIAADAASARAARAPTGSRRRSAREWLAATDPEIAAIRDPS